MPRGRKALSTEAKLLKKLPTGLAEEIDAMGAIELRGLVVSKSVDLEEVRQEEREDTNLKAAKEAAKEYGLGYKEAKQALQAAISYALARLETTTT